MQWGEGSNNLAFIPPLVGMETGKTFLEADLEIFNKSLWKDCLLSFVADMLHPLQILSLPFSPLSSALGDGPQESPQQAVSLLPDQTPQQRQGKRERQGSWQKMGGEGIRYFLPWFLPCWVIALARITCFPPLSVPPGSFHPSLPPSLWV